MSKIHFTSDYLINPTHQITVLVIGAGGNGSQVLNDLAKINRCLNELGHVGLTVSVFDDDIVENSNIGRQQYSESDIGRFKAEVLVSRLNRFYGTDWEAIPEKYHRNHKSANIIISCVDNVASRIEVKYGFSTPLKMVREYEKPLYWLDFGNGKDFGQFVLGSNLITQPKSEFKTSKKLKNVLNMFPNMEKNEDINSPSCSTREALQKQDLFINPILVNIGMNLLWKLFSEYRIDYHGGFVNLKTMSMKPIKI